MGIEFRGRTEFKAALESLVVEKLAVSELAVKAAAEQVQRDTVDQLMLKEHPRGTKTPSAPGEPPAMITGGLKASVTVSPVKRIGPTRVEVQVGPTTPYSRIQELGGTAGHGARLPARPYLAPALRGAKAKIAAIVKAMWSAGGIGGGFGG